MLPDYPLYDTARRSRRGLVRYAGGNLGVLDRDGKQIAWVRAEDDPERRLRPVLAALYPRVVPVRRPAPWRLVRAVELHGARLVWEAWCEDRGPYRLRLVPLSGDGVTLYVRPHDCFGSWGWSAETASGGAPDWRLAAAAIGHVLEWCQWARGPVTEEALHLAVSLAHGVVRGGLREPDVRGKVFRMLEEGAPETWTPTSVATRRERRTCASPTP